MKYTIYFFTIFILTYLTGYLAWWLAPILCFAFFYFFDCKSWQAFAIGLTASGFAWLLAVLMKEFNSSVRIGEILATLFGNIQVTHIYILVYLTIGLVCGFASMTGRLLKEIT